MPHFLIQAIITIENILTAKEFIYNLFKNHPFNFIYVKTKYLKTNYARAFDIRASQRRDKPSISWWGMQISRSTSLMQSRMPGEQSLILILLPFGSYSALSLLDVSPVPVHPTHSVTAQEASCTILHNLLAIDTFLLVEFCLQILEVRRNLIEVKLEIWGH